MSNIPAHTNILSPEIFFGNSLMQAEIGRVSFVFNEQALPYSKTITLLHNSWKN